MADKNPSGLQRDEVYRGEVIEGRPVADSGFRRLWQGIRGLLVSKGEREEADLDQRLRDLPGVTRPNVIAVISPKGGVGKTTNTFLVGNILAQHLRLRAVALDANPDFGTLAALAPDGLRSERTLSDLLANWDDVKAAAEVRTYVSRLPTGLHLLAAPMDPKKLAELTPAQYDAIVTYLAYFYEAILLDCGTGVADPLAQFAIERADQVVLVTTPEWVTSQVVLGALEHLSHERITVVVNKAVDSRGVDLGQIERRFSEQRLHRSRTLPLDPRLQVMLDSGTYDLEGLGRPTRAAIKLLGLTVAEQLA
jgi:MinD-like ATPase involved in chromosome partitioning or flagellar assembly